MRSQVQVGICVRPLVETEIEHGAKTAVEIVGKDLCFPLSASPSGYDFEFMFGPTPIQTRNIYDTMISPLIDHFFQGFTATVFAYGQTGSGKTYLMGTNLAAPSKSRSSTPTFEQTTEEADQDDESSTGTETPKEPFQNTGIIPFSLDDIFKKKSQLEADGAIVQLEMSYLEIYQEECYDLLSFQTVHSKDSAKKGNNKDSFGKKKAITLEMRDNAKGETILEGLSSWPVNDHSEVQKLLSAATRGRATGKTAMNARSSRSHAIATLSLCITIDSDKNTSIFSPARSTSTTIVTSKLHLVDLAGSERVGKTLATGECLKEGVSINKGLLTLGKVVSALNEQQLQSTNNVHATMHIPYRESKLTRLLKDALGGNGMTVMLACCSPADSQFKETLDTLRFATRTSSIFNNAKQNLDEIVRDLPPFVCYSCGAVNPCGSEPSFEPKTALKGLKRGREEDLIDGTPQVMKTFDDDDEAEEGGEEDDETIRFEVSTDIIGSVEVETEMMVDLIPAVMSPNGDLENKNECVDDIPAMVSQKVDLYDMAYKGGFKEQENTVINPFFKKIRNMKNISINADSDKENKLIGISPSKILEVTSPNAMGTNLRSPLSTIQNPSPSIYAKSILSSPINYRLSPLQDSNATPMRVFSPGRSPLRSPNPQSLSTASLLAKLDERASEIFQLQKKLQRSETERMIAENRLKVLQGKYPTHQTKNEEGMASKKRKTIIQRVASAVSCTTAKSSAYSPKGRGQGLSPFGV